MHHLLRLVSLILIAFAAAACGGGGGGGGAPQLNAGVDLTGVWQVDQTTTALSGSCGSQSVGDMETGQVAIDFDPVTRRIIVDPNTPEARVGVVSGLLASIRGSLTANGRTQDFDIQLTFARDGNTFTGTVVFTENDGTNTCTQTLAVNGTRVAAGSQLAVRGRFPMNGEQDVAFDAPVAVQFTADVDSATSGSFEVEGPSGLLAGTVGLQGDTVTFTPDALLDPLTTYTVRVSGVRGTNGQVQAGTESFSFTTAFISEDFRYAIASSDAADAFLGTDAVGSAEVTGGALGTLAAGQLWRFTLSSSQSGTDFYLLRNDQFVNERALEGGDGSGAASMQGFAPPGPFTGQLFDPSLNGRALTLKTQFQGQNRGLGRNTSGGVTDARMLDIVQGNDATEWRLFAVERIVSPFVLEPITTSSVIDGAFETTDAVGLRAPNTRVDLYLLTVTSPLRLTVTMRSDEASTGIDSFLVLLSDDCLNDPDLANWRTQCTLAIDDDGGAQDPGALSPLDAKLDRVLLAPGRFVIAATYFDDQLRTGPYTLQTSTEPARINFPAPLPNLGAQAWPSLQK